MSDNKHQEMSQESESEFEIDYSLINTGPLHIPKKYLKPGFHYQLVSDKSGEIDQYQRWGFTVVKDNIPAGEKKPSQSHPFGAAFTIQSKCGQLLVLMAISDELFAKLQAHREKIVKDLEKSLGKVDGIPDKNLFGTFTKNNISY